MENILQFSSTLEESNNKLWGCHFGVPEVIARVFIDGDDRRVVCTLNEKTEYQCALLPKGDGSFLITVNKKLRDRLGLKVGMKVNVSLKKDESRYGLPMPEELEEVMRQGEEGGRLFHALTPGKLRTLLYLAGHAINPDARISRPVCIV